MGDRLGGRVALITGGGRGIGRAIAEAFAAEGASVGVLDLRQEIADEAARSIGAAGGKAVALVGNVARRDEVFAAVARLGEAFGPVTLLVNNAMWNRYGPLEAQTEETIDRMIDVGLKGVVWGCQAVLEDMTRAGGGAIVNIASPSAVLAMSNGIMYSAIKAAVATRPSPLPGFLGDDAVGTFGRSRSRSDRVDGTPQDVAHAAVFLASNEASFITGDMLFVDGGITYAFS